MIKVIVAIPQRPDITQAQFHSHWRDPHGRLALNIKPMRRYVQAHRRHDVPTGYPAGPYEGFAEVWLDDLATALGLGQDPDYQRYLVPDEPNFCLVSGLMFLFLEEEVILAGSAQTKDTQAFKILHLVRRRAHVSAQDFAHGWTRETQDAALAEAVGVIRHVRCSRALAPTSQAADEFDAVRELWWPTTDHFDRSRRDAPAAWRQLMESGDIDTAASLVVPIEEFRVLWP